VYSLATQQHRRYQENTRTLHLRKKNKIQIKTIRRIYAKIVCVYAYVPNWFEAFIVKIVMMINKEGAEERIQESNDP